jgi:ubiquinone/menaquinone biosynthesis C-methylase UbiE
MNLICGDRPAAGIEPARHSSGIPVLDRQLGTWRIKLERTALTADEVASRYDHLAARQRDILDRLGYLEAYARLVRKAALAMPRTIYDGARVLDCGSGTAALTHALHRVVNARLDYHLLDLSPRMLETAAESLRRAGVSARVHRADVRDIPCADGSFDLVMAAHVIEHLPDPRSCLREMRRVLKPGGRLLVVVTRRGILGSLLQIRWPIHKTGGPELRRWLRESGFSRMRVIRLDGPLCRRMSVACLAVKEGR